MKSVSGYYAGCGGWLDPFLRHLPPNSALPALLGIGERHMYLKSCSLPYTNGSFEIIIVLRSLFLIMNLVCLSILLGETEEMAYFCYNGPSISNPLFSMLFHPLCSGSTPCALSQFSIPRGISAPCCPGHLSFPSQPRISVCDFICNFV